MASDHIYGITLDNGSTITHGDGVNTKDAFTDIPVTINELQPGSSNAKLAFSGQSGYIKFDTDIRLPRHVHISTRQDGEPFLLHERIFVANGAALVQLGGEIYVIPPDSLVTIAPGVPHTWTACPAGLEIPPRENDSISSSNEPFVSNGEFLMLYEYEEITGFFPTAQTETLKTEKEYIRCDDLESIRIPKLSAAEVRERCWFVYNRNVQKLGRQ